jgi:hypothetical protein
MTATLTRSLGPAGLAWTSKPPSAQKPAPAAVAVFRKSRRVVRLLIRISFVKKLIQAVNSQCKQPGAGSQTNSVPGMLFFYEPAEAVVDFSEQENSNAALGVRQ